MAVAITRQERSADELRRAAARCKDAKAARRMLAIALVMTGERRDEAARACGMDRQSLRDWVHRYNAEGLDGLSDRPRGRSRPRLTAEQEAEIAAVVEAGPDVAVHGVVRWRRVDLRNLIAERYGVHYHERTVGKLLNKLGFCRISPRPAHPRADLAAQEAFKRTSPSWHAGRSRRKPPASRSRSGSRARPGPRSGDEARIGQKGTLTRIRARRGSRPRKPRDNRYSWAYLFGAVCPERATGAALVMPYADTEAMTRHLAEIGANVAVGAHALVVVDRAGWHGADALVVPDNITLLPLPAAAPELNPQENVWEWLRKNKLALRVFDGYDHIVDVCCQAWNDFIANPETVASVTRREWAKAVII